MNNIPFWNDLKVLIIKDTSYFEWGEIEEFMTKFARDLSSKHLNNLKTIKIDMFIERALLSSILCPVLSLEFVHLYWDQNDINLPPELRGFSIDENDTISVIPPNIESLHLYEYETLCDGICVKLNNVREICVYQPTQYEMDWFLDQNLTNLQRINVINTNENRQKSIKSLFATPSINYISIKTDKDNYNMNMMIDILNNALKGISKQSMKIRLISDYECDAKGIQKEILKLINTLKIETTDFMIIGKFHIKVNDEINLDSNKDCLLIKSKIENENDINKICKFVISNKECKINGYQEMQTILSMTNYFIN